MLSNENIPNYITNYVIKYTKPQILLKWKQGKNNFL